MGRVVVLGEPVRIGGYALAGATPVAAADADAVRRAWAELPADVSLVVMTAAAGAVLADEVQSRPEVLTVTIPA